VKGVPADTSINDIKAYFAKFGRVRYADTINPEEQTVIIRFAEPSAAQIALTEIGEKKITNHWEHH